jgi:hypothetical protein
MILSTNIYISKIHAKIVTCRRSLENLGALFFRRTFDCYTQEKEKLEQSASIFFY